MKLHHRYAVVAATRNRLSEKVLAEMSDNDITAIEMIGILLALAAESQRYALRFERHGNYDKKADED